MGSGKGLVVDEAQMQSLEAVLAKLRRISGSRFAALITTGGQPVVISPSEAASDTLSLAALAAGSFAATRQLAQLLSERQFSLLFHEGEESNLHVVQVNEQALLLLTFGRDTPVGRVRLYTNRALEALKPILEAAENSPESASLRIPEEYRGAASAALEDLLPDGSE